MVRCLNCMKIYDEEFEVCPHCGFVRGTAPKEKYHLCPGVLLAGKYRIGTVIGFGGFGIIYKAWDESLDRVVAVKEYYPTMYLSRLSGEKTARIYDRKNQGDFEQGKKTFLNEARNLAKFNNHPNIVHVYDFFEENGTAYFVMEHLEGCNLKKYMQINRKRGQVMSVDTAVQITQAVLSALKVTHAAGILHRDIKPGNIFICKDTTIKLIDFGAARFSDTDKEKTRSVIITPGYAPVEQYQTRSKQGPYTDIYAVGAVLYEMLVGEKPDESINRKVEDTLEDPSKCNPSVPANIGSAVMRALAVQPEIRFQNVEQFSKALRSEKEVRTAKQEIRHRKIWRAIRIAGMVAAVLVGIALCVFQFYSARQEAVLSEAKITVWVPYDENSSEETESTLFEEMAAEFEENNPAVSVKVRAIPEKDYVQTLQNALADGTAPVLFDSTQLWKEAPENAAAHCADLEDLFQNNSLNQENFYLLPEYDQLFPERKQIPLTFEVPVLYCNASAKTDASLGAAQGVERQSFLEGQADAYLGSVADYDSVQEALAGRYRLVWPEETQELSITPTNVFSVNEKANEAEYAAALRLLYYYLSDTAQDYLTIQNRSHLPVNKAELQVYIENEDEFEGLTDYLDRLSVKGE